LIGDECLSHLYKGANDKDAHLDGLFGAADGGGRECAVLGEDLRQASAAAVICGT
jgi:3-deoxy-D-manno-octulosonate 8-phosphate phosphatase KdsC-like HAD superfamily phosphatase